MKKCLVWVLVLLTLFSAVSGFSGCEDIGRKKKSAATNTKDDDDEKEEENDEEIEEDEEINNGCSHVWIEATCTKSKTCELCGVSKGSAKGHSWGEATCDKAKMCSRCGLKEGEPLGHKLDDDDICRICGEKCTWNVGDFVDEFKHSTGKHYAYTIVFGTYDDSVSDDELCMVYMEIVPAEEGPIVCFELWKYTDSPVTALYTEYYNIVMLDTNNKKHYLEGGMLEDDSNLYVMSGSQTIIDALLEQGEVSFYIEEEDRTYANYLFTVETSNFKSMFEQYISEENVL